MSIQSQAFNCVSTQGLANRMDDEQFEQPRVFKTMPLSGTQEPLFHSRQADSAIAIGT